MTRTAAAVATLLVLVASSSAAAAAAAADSSRLQNATTELGPVVDSEFISIEFGGRTRDAVLYVPPSAPPGVALPLVFNYHGYGSDGLQQVFYSLNNPLADEEMFAVIYPDGIPSPRSQRRQLLLPRQRPGGNARLLPSYPPAGLWCGTLTKDLLPPLLRAGSDGRRWLRGCLGITRRLTAGCAWAESGPLANLLDRDEQRWLHVA